MYNNEKSMMISYDDLDCVYHNEDRKVDIYNLSKADVKKIVDSLEIIYEKNPNDKKLKKIVSRFNRYLKIFSK